MTCAIFCKYTLLTNLKRTIRLKCGSWGTPSVVKMTYRNLRCCWLSLGWWFSSDTPRGQKTPQLINILPFIARSIYNKKILVSCFHKPEFPILPATQHCPTLTQLSSRVFLRASYHLDGVQVCYVWKRMRESLVGGSNESILHSLKCGSCYVIWSKSSHFMAVVENGMFRDVKHTCIPTTLEAEMEAGFIGTR